MEDRLSILENVQYNLENALESLERNDYYYGAIDSLLSEVKEEIEELEDKIAEREELENKAEEREYWNSQF